MTAARKPAYDLIVLGATGYTGKLTAEYIATHLPTNLNWAVAGRSESALCDVLYNLRCHMSDRLEPKIEVVNLTPNELDSLVKKCIVLINTVGPYHLYSSPVVAACAKNGTHYLDVTGESPWTIKMIEKYHSLAQSTNAIIIPQIGIESSPSDLVTYALATLIRKDCNCPTGKVIGTMHEIKSMPSGGTLNTVLTLKDSFSTAEIARATNGSWCSSPIQHPKTATSTPFLSTIYSRLIGVCTVPELGTLTTSPGGGANVTIVQRTWGLLDEGRYYGPNFTYREYLTVRNRFVGVLMHIAVAIGVMSIAFPPVRWIIKKLVTAPGQGADREVWKKDVLEFRALAAADQDKDRPRRALGRLRYEGGAYYLTGIFLAEAAMVLLKDKKLVKSLGGGILTPAMLGQRFIDCLTKAGVIFETEMLPD